MPRRPDRLPVTGDENVREPVRRLKLIPRELLVAPPVDLQIPDTVEHEEELDPVEGRSGLRAPKPRVIEESRSSAWR